LIKASMVARQRLGLLSSSTEI